MHFQSGTFIRNMSSVSSRGATFPRSLDGNRMEKPESDLDRHVSSKVATRSLSDQIKQISNYVAIKYYRTQETYN